MTDKTYALAADQIEPLATGFGGCLATDRITVDGKPVGYMVREPTTREYDSGWRFMCGDESPDYMRCNDNHGVYDVNTIANYCPDIIEHLTSSPGSAFQRDAQSGQLVRVAYEPPSD